MMNYEDFINKSMSDGGAIIINKYLIHKLGLNETIILTELFSKYSYFEKNIRLQSDGSFFCTYDDLELTTCLAQKAQRSAIKKLHELGFINTYNKGLPSRRYFKITINQALFDKFVQDGMQVLNNKIINKESKKKDKKSSNPLNSPVYPKEYDVISEGISHDMPKNIISYPQVGTNKNKEQEQNKKNKQTNTDLSVCTHTEEEKERETVDKDYTKLFNILLQLFPDYKDKIQKKLIEYQSKGEKFSELIDTFNWLNSEKVHRINWYMTNAEFSNEKKFNTIAKKIVEEKDKAKADINSIYEETDNQYVKPTESNFNEGKTPIDVDADAKKNLGYLFGFENDNDTSLIKRFKNNTIPIYKDILKCFANDNVYIDGFSGMHNQLFQRVYNLIKNSEVTK